MKKVLCLMFVVCILVTAIGCGDKTELPSLWENAVYTDNAEFGNGSKTVTVTVTAGEKSIDFTVKTDDQYLGDALLAHELISGEDSEYGLYIKSVNGIVADYDVDQSYWAFYKNGEYMMSGVDSTEFADGEHYELVYSK